MSDDNGNKDTRMVCKYGSKCYQKNPAHHAKFKHPPKKRTMNFIKQDPMASVTRKFESDEEEEEQAKKKVKVSNDVSDSDSDEPAKVRNEGSDAESAERTEDVKTSNDISDSDTEAAETVQEIIPLDVDPKEFIKEKFLCEMPDDFYQFWEFCTTLRKDNPAEAFASVGVHLVGPYDVLAGKFKGIPDRPDEEYLLHWRFYYDPPEFQTVLKWDKPDGLHIGYFRDDMKDKPVFLASNCPKTDGTFAKIGDNIFAAIFLQLEETKKTCDPFKKTQVAGLISRIKAEAEKRKFDLNRKTDSMRRRFVIRPTNNRLGLNVPYDKKSQVGYRDLALNDKGFKELLLKIKSAHPDQMDKFLNELQPVLTYASIALDECDFGTGIKLGWDVLFFGIDSLNKTVSRFLCNSYNLLKKPEFAKIAKAHMDNRRKSNNPSILK